jgi:serine/threonine-protein kinase
VHRDLKPANIKITGGDMVKVLDFGLAKALAPAGTSDAADLANSPDADIAGDDRDGDDSRHRRLHGARASQRQAVDRRADIWALGVVLFEMLAGEALYRGETVTETIAHVITQAAGLECIAGDDAGNSAPAAAALPRKRSAQSTAGGGRRADRDRRISRGAR